MPNIELMGATYTDVPAVDLPKSGGGTARFYDPNELTFPVTSVNNQTGDVVLKTSDITNDSGYITGMYIASYGSSTYAQVLAAYQANKVVYCRASSSNPPSSGSQNRMAFLAYVNDSTTPTEFEFQYYRSVATHSDSQQGDQVFVYKLNSSTGWSVTTREAYTKISPSTGLSKSYSSGTLTVSVDNPLPSVSASDNNKVLKVSNGAWAVKDALSSCAATLSSAGWYRVINYNGGTLNNAKFGVGTIFDINIETDYYATSTCLHKVSMFGAWNNPRFANEVSHGNSNIVDKIRYTYDSSNNGHIDIHYNVSQGNLVAVSFICNLDPQYYHWAVATGPSAVAASPSGETVLAEHTFIADGHNFTMPVYMNGTLLHS